MKKCTGANQATPTNENKNWSLPNETFKIFQQAYITKLTTQILIFSKSALIDTNVIFADSRTNNLKEWIFMPHFYSCPEMQDQTFFDWDFVEVGVAMR
jgi:hypothetical protein